MVKQPDKIRDVIEELNFELDKMKNHHRFVQIDKELKAIQDEMETIYAKINVAQKHAKIIGLTPKKREKRLKELNEEYYVYKEMKNMKNQEKKELQASYEVEIKMIQKEIAELESWL